MHNLQQRGRQPVSFLVIGSLCLVSFSVAPQIRLKLAGTYFDLEIQSVLAVDDDKEKDKKKKKKKNNDGEAPFDLKAEVGVDEGLEGKDFKNRSAAGLSDVRANVVTGSMLSTEEMEEIISLHTEIRAEAGVEPLTWSVQVAAYAQQWADRLAEKSCEIVHRPDSGKWKQLFGENIFQGAKGIHDIKDAVWLWREEKDLYKGGKFEASMMEAAHYTQMVWRKTKQFGCAKSLCGRSVIFVCNYDPAGNVLGQRPF
jgi:pathogenesis-related protein 1